MIPEDVALSAEELPPDFFDTPPVPAPERPQGRGAGSSRAKDRPPDASDAPPRRASAGDARPTRGGPPKRAGGTQRQPATDVTGALLGSGASAQEQPGSVRDTVAAIEELFPGTLLAASPRPDAAQETEADGPAGEDVPPDGDDDAAEAAEAEEAGGRGNARLDFGPRDRSG